MMTDKIEETVLFRFKTVQTNAIRILFESLKNILSDVNFKADATGLKLTTIDGTNSAIVNLFLQKEKFEEYICTRVTNIGVNLLSIFKILKGIKHADTISFTIYQNEDGHMYIQCENSEKQSKICTKIKLLDMDEKIYKIPDIRFNSYITMPSSDFQTYISDLSNISNEIHFTYSNALKLRAIGDFADQSITINETNDNPDTEEQYGVYHTKYILLFTKSTNLCSTVEIYLKTGYPLTILYSVANLGQIKYCLAPKPN
jgi:proliferating cell nuclear antigen|tara:strand:- start:3841 stop:4614 length:774 start_codon:yes stop_codon:yes gene_type:complete